jgi:hypothetical protein
MKSHFITLIGSFFLLFLVACHTNANKPNEPTNSTNFIEGSIPKWYFQTQEDTLGNPKTQIYLIAKDSIKIILATATFTVVEKQEYADKKLPPNTLTACAGFWAGLDQQFIVIDSSDYWVVKAKYEDEGSEEPEVFETLKAIKK